MVNLNGDTMMVLAYRGRSVSYGVQLAGGARQGQGDVLFRFRVCSRPVRDSRSGREGRK